MTSEYESALLTENELKEAQASHELRAVIWEDNNYLGEAQVQRRAARAYAKERVTRFGSSSEEDRELQVKIESVSSLRERLQVLKGGENEQR